MLIFSSTSLVSSFGTKDVEEKMSKSNLKSCFLSRDLSGKQTCDSGTNIGTKSDREHLLKVDNSHTNKWDQGRSSDGRTLYKNSKSSSYRNTDVSVHISCLVNDTGRGSEEHFLQYSDKDNET